MDYNIGNTKNGIGWVRVAVPKGERVSYYKYMYIHILYVVGRMWWVW